MVDITIQGANSYQYSGSIKKIRCVDLKVESAPDKFTCQKVYESTVPYYVRVYGQIAKTLYVSVDDKPLMTKNLEANDDGTAVEILIDCQSLGLVPGVHTVSAYLETDGVPSNTVMTDFIYHPSTVAPATYVIVTEYPTECMSYETPAVYYWVYNTAQTDGYKNTISLIVDGVTIADDISQAQKEGESLRWNVTGLKPDARNICEISCGGSSRTFEIYCHYSGIFEPTADGSVLMLSAEGRSNSTSLERRLEWKCTNNRGNDYYAILNNFNWNNNGWITDEQTGRDCLRISNGASVEIPLQLFPNGAPSTGGFTFEFEFKPYNLYSYNLLTLSTTTIEDETNEDDDAVEILREFDASRAVISYIDTDNDGKACGMCCGTQDAFFRMSDGKNVTVRYTNDRVVNVAISINAAKE